MSSPIIPACQNVTVIDPSGINSTSFCYVIGGRPGLDFCCNQLGNSTIQVSGCYAYCDLPKEVTVDGGSAFTECVQSLPQYPSPGFGCRYSFPPDPTTTSQTPTSPPTTAASNTNTPGTGAAVHSAAQSVGLATVLVSTLLVGGFMSSGALFSLI